MIAAAPEKVGMTREQFQREAAQLVNSPLWASLVDFAREEIAREWLNAKDDAERQGCAARLSAVHAACGALRRAANSLRKG